MNLLTESDLAQRLSVSLEDVKAMRTKHRWEHVRLGRYVVRYTEAQAERIVAAHTIKTNAPAPISDQTDLSAKRSA